MIRKQEREQPVTQIVVEDYFCSRCGGGMRDASGNVHGLLASDTGGWGSKIGDLISWSFALCETCLLDWVFPELKTNAIDGDREGVIGE